MNEEDNFKETRLHEEYLDSLTEKEKKAYVIAKDHLGSSFSLEKSIGFIKWRNNK